MSKLRIKNARLIYALSDGLFDILIEDGRIADISKEISAECESIDAQGNVAAPGFIDIHCHLREPGQEYKEDIITGAAAAAAGGFTTVCCMPNTLPAADNGEIIKHILKRAEGTGVSVLPIGAATNGLLGEKLCDFEELFRAGAVAVSDDGCPIENSALMKAAMLEAKKHSKTVVSHCEVRSLTAGGVINEGRISRELGVKGLPKSAEEIMIARDIILCEETGARMHIAHVSTAGGVRLVREAKARGLGITAETCPHYFSLTDEAVLTEGVNAKMSPPLRGEEDRLAIIDGLKTGVIDAIATDHAPHSHEEKNAGLKGAPNGIIGFETALAVSITHLVREGHISLDALIGLLTAGPAMCLGIEKAGLSAGATADIVIFDPEERWVLEESAIKSKSKNTPYKGKTLYGRVKKTIARGKIIYGA